MEVVTADDDSARHLGGDNTPSEDATTDGNLTGKWTFLIYTHPSYGLFQLSKNAHAPIYVPFIASAGVLNPRPTSLYQRLSFVDTFFPPFHQTFCGQTCPGQRISGNSTHHEPLHFGRAAAFEMLFQSTRSCGTIKSVQKRQISTNLFSHCELLRAWRGECRKLALFEGYFQLTTPKLVN